MNAKKLTLTMSALVLGLTSCGTKTLTRQEACTKLDEIVKATPAAQTKLTAVNQTMEDLKDDKGNVTTKAGVMTTYVFDAEKNYSHVTFGSGREITVADKKYAIASGDEFYAYATETGYVYGLKFSNTSAKLAVESSDASNALMKDFAKTQINAFVTYGRENWHNGAGGLSAYLKRQDTLDAKKEDVVVGSETIQAGATEGTKKSHIALKDEKYTSSGDGNVVLEFDALYPDAGVAKLHEPLKYEFNNNILTHWYNKKGNNYAGNEWTMDYGKSTITECSYSDAGLVATALCTLVPTIISTLVAIDAPTDTANNYATVWAN